MSDAKPYGRVLVKLSGESLGAGGGGGVDAKVAAYIVDELIAARAVCREIAVVVGAGNMVRGRALACQGMDRVRCDHAGMIGTAVNAVVLEAMLKSRGQDAVAFSAFEIGQMLRPMSIGAARETLAEGKIAVFAGGTGNPFFTTDSAAALRALELRAEILLKATTVDGVYSSDPKSDPDAKRYDHVGFDEVLARRLGVMDLTAVSMCMEHGLPIRIFKFDAPGALRRVACGADEGTLVS